MPDSQIELTFHIVDMSIALNNNVLINQHPTVSIQDMYTEALTDYAALFSYQLYACTICTLTDYAALFNYMHALYVH